MTDARSSDRPQPSLEETFDRARPSVVDVCVRREDGSEEFHTIGVAIEPGGITAWKKVEALGAEWDQIENIGIRQAEQTWQAQLHSMRADWGLCAVAVKGGISLPLIPWRRSRTFALGDRLLYAVASQDPDRPNLGWTELIDVYTFVEQRYDRPQIWTTRLDPDMPVTYTLAFDLEGRLAGLLEPLPKRPGTAALMPAEWAAGLVQRSWVEMLSKMDREQLANEFRGRGATAYGPEALAVIGLVLFDLGDADGCCEAWEAAFAKDPLNPWLNNAEGAALDLRGRREEGDRYRERAIQLADAEPSCYSPEAGFRPGRELLVAPPRPSGSLRASAGD